MASSFQPSWRAKPSDSLSTWNEMLLSASRSTETFAKFASLNGGYVAALRQAADPALSACESSESFPRSCSCLRIDKL